MKRARETAGGTAPPARLAQSEVGRLLAVARAFAQILGQEAARVELHAGPGGSLGSCAILSTSGTQVLRVVDPGDAGYPEADAAWQALQPGPRVDVAIRSAIITMDGGIFFA